MIFHIYVQCMIYMYLFNVKCFLLNTFTYIPPTHTYSHTHAHTHCHIHTYRKTYTQKLTYNKYRILYTILESEPLLDSSNMGMEDWAKIAKDIEKYYRQFNAFVVLHGTDTMAYTASALSFMLEDLGKSVVVTGSQVCLVCVCVCPSMFDVTLHICVCKCVLLYV